MARLYEAEQSGDWGAFYRMFAPELREDSAYDEFMAEAGERDFHIASWSIREINPMSPLELPEGIEAGAAVRMRVAVDNADGSRETIDDQTDYWVWIAGEWYLSWRGWPDD